MSKHLLEALAALSHMSLAQTIDCGNCEPFSGTLNIHLMEKDEQGNTTTSSDTRYVKVSDSQGNTKIHPIVLNQGEGTLLLEGIEASQVVVVQVDQDGQQIVDQDRFAITYVVNMEAVEEDYASHVFHQGNQNQTLDIINQILPITTLTISKVLLDEFQEMMDFHEDMNFSFQLEGMGKCLCIDLNCTNDFCKTLSLPVGRYLLCEEEDPCFQTSYSFDGRDPRSRGAFELKAGAHEMQVINRKRTHSVLTLDKYIRDINGELIKPQNHECFRVRIIGDYVDELIELNAENDFAMDVCDLPNGFYDVQEVDCDCYTTTYLVNAEKECDYAQVEMRECQSASVLIINNPQVCSCEQDSPLRICKYVRRFDGCLVKPDPCYSFKVMLAGCGVCETFNLNASNNFCVDIEHICCGEYEVKELDACDFVASYIVNDGCESTRAILCIHEGACNSVQIINEERNKGEVSICKVMRDACGEIVKPDKNQRFLVTLRSYFCRETFVLDASNDFCVHVSNLREGSYEVKERRCDGFDTTYVVNNHEEGKKARFLVANGCCADIKIINSPCIEPSGDLRICKYIANDFGDYVKPAADEEFEIQVQGPCMDNCYVLRAANNWCVILEGMKKGVYRIMETSECNYTTQYFVNGCEMEDALVCMEAKNQEVQIVNTRRSFGNLKLSAMIQTCDDCLVKPSSTQRFELLVESVCDSRCVVLDACNNFCVLLDDMEKGRYRITQKDNYGYKVMYNVNGEVSANALVDMEGCNVSVSVINQMMNCSGLLRVRKYVETLDGRIIRPCDDDRYDFHLTSRCLNNDYTLSKRNDFCVFFDDLEEGTYEICEDECVNMETYYRINGTICDCGRFELHREDIEVDIINKVMPLPTVCVHKRIREEGCLVKPQPCESFEFMIKGRGLQEVYCLNEENDFCVCLEGLCNQHYEIKELGVDCHTMYQINDQLCDHGYFLFEHQDMDITIINQEVMEPQVTIRKWVEDECGNRVKPCRDDSFEVMIEGESYKQCFALHEENDWCIHLEGLACGCYAIHERGCGRAQIMVNDCESRDGCFTLQEEDITIDVINQAGCANSLQLFAYELVDGEEITPSKDKVYEIEVLCGKQKECFTLNCENDWCIVLEDIIPGCYRIFAKAQPDMLYEVNGECFENAVDVDVEVGDVCVKLLDPTYPQRDIKISKRVKDANGDLKRPPRHACYEMVLQGACKEYFTLSEENQWCAYFEDMPEGIYEVKELYCDGKVEYQIDGKAMSHQGYFTLANTPVEVCVINEAAQAEMSTLCVRAMVKNCEGDMECPNHNDVFEMMLDGDGVREDVILNQANNFQMCFTDLKPQTYTITQQPNDEFTRITYCIKNEEKSDGTITLDHHSMQVDVINYANCAQGSIRVMKYIKDESCGCLKRPCMDDQFDVQIQGEDFNQTVVLNASNKWCYVFDQLMDGTYTIQELGGDHVSYIVNGGKEMKEAEVYLHGNEANVKIINTSESGTKKGSIEIAKVMKDASGNYVQPNEEDSYWVSIKGEMSNQRVLLHSANHFLVEVRGLEAGIYEVIEEDNVNVLYSVNGGSEQKRAIVQVNANANSVNVINAMHEKGEITLSKYVQGEDGILRTPQDGQSYRIHVSKPGFNTVVVLDMINNYTTTLRDLESGMYVIDELDHDGVTYIINGGNQVDRGVVNVNKDMNDVQIINRQGEIKGSIRMVKYVRGANGQLNRPEATASYQFRVSKPGFNQLYTLNYANNWTIDLLNLEDGNYVINETTGDGEDVSYIINEGSETNFGIVNVQGNANNVQIINGKRNQNSGSILINKLLRGADGELRPPMGDATYSFYISKPNFYEVYTLNANNQWGTLISDLEDGDYVITEVNPNTKVTYIVNGGSEVDSAIVRVMGNENDVQIINAQTVNEKGSITVTKYIRNETQDLVRPEGDFAVRVQLLRTGFSEVVTLDFTNDWTYTFSNLEDGDYVLNEINSPYGTSWIIDGKAEVRYAIVLVRGDSHQADMINTIRQGEGTIVLSKYIRNPDGTLVRPQGDVRYLFYVSKPGFSQSYILMANNNWTVTLPNLEDGNYIISEGGGESNVTYIINGGNETVFGLVKVSANRNEVQAINTIRPSTNGSITITKYIRDASGALVRPQNLFAAQVRLTKPGFNEVYTLNALNDWTVLVTDLVDGTYTLSEVNSEDQVTWRINGGSEVDFATVVVSENDNQVMMINTPIQGIGTIQVSKYIRNALGQLTRPSANESFLVQMIGPVTRLTTLDVNNQWTDRVMALPKGPYQVREISNSDYEVTYIVNDGEEQSSALVNVDQNDTTVGIINSTMASTNVLELRKYKKNADGILETPADGDVYNVEVKGDNYQETFVLNGGNGFVRRVVNLPDGDYSVTELSGGGFTITYRVNSGPITSTATVTMGNDQNNVVEILNEMSENRNTLDVFKFILDDFGNFQKPTNEQVFRFLLSGSNFQQYFTLSSANDWHVFLNTLSSGPYEIIEQSSSRYDVSYIVNGGEFLDSATFEAFPGSQNIVEIINSPVRSELGSLTLEKKIRDAQGDLIIPGNNESFTVNITNQQTMNTQSAVLNEANGYLTTIGNLAYGRYLVEEVAQSGYRVSYIVNEGSEQGEAIVNIQTMNPQNVMMINTQEPMVVNARKNSDIVIVLE